MDFKITGLQILLHPREAEKIKQMQSLSRRPESVIKLLSTKLRRKIKQVKGRCFSVSLSNFLGDARDIFWRFLPGIKSSSFILIVEGSPLNNANLYCR